MEKPEGFDEWVTRHKGMFGPNDPLEAQYKFVTGALHAEKMKNNNAYMAVVSKEMVKTHERNMQDLEIEARTIYNSGKFIQECRKEFAKQWYNDTYMLDFILLMGASLRVSNAFEGIHLHISGDTQSGKSAGAKTAMKFLAQNATMTRTFTPKAIFYSGEDGSLHEGMVVLCDDTTQSPEIAEVYRNILTSWFDGVERDSVNMGKKVTLKVPARVSLIMTNVESVARETDDGQDESRYLTIEVRRTVEEMERIFQFVQEEAREFDVNQMIMLRMVWDNMPAQTDIKLHRKFEFQGTMRESKRFLTMIQAHALLCGRDTTNESDVDEVSKLMTYAKRMVNSNTAPLTRNETALLATLTPEWETCPEVSARLKTTRDKIYIAIRGNRGSFDNPTGGLLKKEPRFETKVTSEVGETNLRLIRLRR